MPALYAHDRFGRKVQEQMPEDLKELVSRYESSYLTGLQGPDLFFFYRPWSGNRVRRYGTHLHEANAAPFFRHAITVIRQHGRDKEYAYLLGFLCHFILDSECHPYIARAIETTGVAHLEIEAEFEKHLLRLDDHKPMTFRLDRLVFSDSDTVDSIVPFYPSMNAGKIRSSLDWMRTVRRLFHPAFAPKRQTINAVMKAMGVYPEMNGLMLQKADQPLCRETNEVLYQKFLAAVPLAVSIQEAFDNCIRNGAPLPERLRRNFE